LSLTLLDRARSPSHGEPLRKGNEAVGSILTVNHPSPAGLDDATESLTFGATRVMLNAGSCVIKAMQNGT